MGQKSPDEPDSYASRTDVESAIAGLSAADSERLERFATWRATGLKGLGLGVDGNDLLQDAMRLALEGGRQWPNRIRFVTYLLQLVRNVADHHARRCRCAVKADREDDGPDGCDPDSFVPTTLPDPERLAVARQLAGRIKIMFAKDERVSLIIEGWETGMTGPDIKKDLDLSQNAYETAVTRLRRGARSMEG